MSHLFISYSHKDKDYVHKLREALLKEGFEVWIDDQIDYGSEWPKIVTQKLDLCDGVIVVLSNNSYESDMVGNEVARAREKKKPMFPLLLDGDNWLIVQSKQFVDISDGSLPKEKFYKRLGEITPRIKKKDHKTKVEPVFEKPVVKIPKPKKDLGTKFPTWGIVLIVFAILALFVWGLTSIPASPEATQTPFATQTIFVERATKTPAPATSTATISQQSTLGIGLTMTGEDGATLVYVPAGEFMMGSTSEQADQAFAECQKQNHAFPCQREWFTSATPLHEVYLDAYFIDQYEITNTRYADCVAAGVCQPPYDRSSATRASYYGNAEFDNFPVINVTWFEASTYCEWRGNRLPTEAEWEKAARGINNRIYPWGNDFNGNIVNFCDTNCTVDYGWANKNYNDGYTDTSPVGNYPDGVSPYSVYDMAGNVSEWTSGWYDVYPGSDPSKSTAFGQLYRVLRGGSYADFDTFIRSTLRGTNDPARGSFSNGFRCARSLP
jgi:formylglycine-generating enzyme required for sulfatase activity